MKVEEVNGFIIPPPDTWDPIMATMAIMAIMATMATLATLATLGIILGYAEIVHTQQDQEEMMEMGMEMATAEEEIVEETEK